VQDRRQHGIIFLATTTLESHCPVFSELWSKLPCSLLLLLLSVFCVLYQTTASWQREKQQSQVMNQQSSDKNISAGAAMLFKAGIVSSESMENTTSLDSVHDDGVDVEDSHNNMVRMYATTTTTTTASDKNCVNDESHPTMHQETRGSQRIPAETPITHATTMTRKKRKRHGQSLPSTGFGMDEDDEMVETDNRTSCSMSLSEWSSEDDENANGRTRDGGSSGDGGNDDDLLEGEAVSISEDIASVVTTKTSNVTEKSSPPQRQQQHAGTSHNTEQVSEKNINEGQEHQNQQQHQELKNLDREQNQQQHQQPEGWRVKLYRLNTDGSWDDCGTGRILCLYKPSEVIQSDENDSGGGDAWVYRELGEPTLCMHSELSTTAAANGPQPSASSPTSRILLRTRILLREAYQRQGENIITWCEPYLEEGSPSQGVDLALSFQDHAGCMDIWKQVTQVQARANELVRMKCKGGKSVTDMDHVAAPVRHANSQRKDQQETWANVASEVSGNQHHTQNHSQGNNGAAFEDSVAALVNSYRDSSPGNGVSPNIPQLPNPPTLSNLEGIADAIAAVQVRNSEAIMSVFLAL
jgi:hypothetical protein